MTAAPHLTIRHVNSVSFIEFPLPQEDYSVCLCLHDQGCEKMQHLIDTTPGLHVMTGDELLAALAEKGRGLVSAIGYQKFMNLNNGPDGQPALQDFDTSGRLRRVLFMNDGLMNDGPNGQPCQQHLDEDGYIISATRYHNSQKTADLSIADLLRLNAPKPPKNGIGPAPAEPPLNLSEKTKEAVRDMLKKNPSAGDWL
jgi:hypothetical protein